MLQIAKFFLNITSKEREGYKNCFRNEFRNEQKKLKSIRRNLKSLHQGYNFTCPENHAYCDLGSNTNQRNNIYLNVALTICMLFEIQCIELL
jgi:hypothetical protein